MNSTSSLRKELFDRKKILDTSLVTDPETIQDSSEFWSASDPVAWIVTHGMVVDAHSFYEKLAQKLELPYQKTIQIPINPISNKLPLLTIDEMSRELVYHHETKSKHYLYIANPFISLRTIKDMQQKIGKECAIVLTSHGEINHTLSYFNAYGSHTKAEDTINFARPELSSQSVFRNLSNWYFYVLTLIFCVAIVLIPTIGLGVFILINIVYFLLNPFKIWLHFAGRKKQRQISVPDDVAQQLSANELPYYTIILPLKHEDAVVKQLMQALTELDYPMHKLDVKFAVEVSDSQTINALADIGISEKKRHLATPENCVFHLVKVPISAVSTKPRSCNFALQLARGAITVIYDAEDRPDPLQLKKAWYVLLNQKLSTICVQAKLTYYNQKKNLLTNFFTLEYGYWFDSFLPGLQAANIPFPLGGTSNHFITQTLKRIGSWDAHNVTEDADLGWRINRFEYETVMLDSYTHEEAMSNLWGWIKQRTRWQKGFMVTVLVHASQLRTLLADLGWWKMSSSVVLYSSVIFLPLVNPILWVIFLMWLSLLLLPITFISDIPVWLLLMGTVNLVFGNVSYIIMHLLVVLKSKKYNLIPIALLIPLYWPLLSIATYRALAQLFYAPNLWEKSAHGLE